MSRALPEKVCAACGRSFAWRRKWAKDWESVRYCSDACRTGRYVRARAAAERPDGSDGLMSQLGAIKRR